MLYKNIMGFLGLSKEQKEHLANEVISERVRLKLTRLLRAATRSSNLTIQIIRQNHAINIIRNVLNLPLYELEAEDGEYYYPAEYGWHNSQIELAFRIPNTVQLVEILADLIEEGVLNEAEVNETLEENNLSFRFKLYEDISSDARDVQVEIFSIEELNELLKEDLNEHPNIRLLISRMDDALKRNDYSAVLHASASIFETLAKEITGIPSVQNKTLASFFDRYKNDSSLPEEILDYILNIYRRRNTEPLAGHGSLEEPSINHEEAVILSEMTKAFVRIERQLANIRVNLDVHHNFSESNEI